MKLFKTIILETIKEFGTPMDFKKALFYCRQNQFDRTKKICYGTKDKKFHLIQKGDRDFDKGIYLSDFSHINNEQEAISKLTGSHFIG